MLCSQGRGECSGRWCPAEGQPLLAAAVTVSLLSLSTAAAATGAANLILRTRQLTERERERARERGCKWEGGWREEDAPFWCRAERSCVRVGGWGCSDDKAERQHVTLRCHREDGLSYGAAAAISPLVLYLSTPMQSLYNDTLLSACCLVKTCSKGITPFALACLFRTTLGLEKRLLCCECGRLQFTRLRSLKVLNHFKTAEIYWCWAGTILYFLWQTNVIRRPVLQHLLRHSAANLFVPTEYVNI